MSFNFMKEDVFVADRPTPAYMDEVEPTGIKWETEAFESFCDIYKNEIDFLIEAKQSTKKLMEEESFTEKKWTDLITKIRKVEEEVYYHAETFSYKDWDVDLCIMWHKFWYSIKC
jgi:hypothetical protein